MSDDSLHTLGRKQRADLDNPPDPPLEDELSRPFDERERAAIFDAVFERVDANSSAARHEDNPQPAAEPGQVVQLGARRRGPLIGSLLALVAAVALVWWAWPKPKPEHGPIAAVPAYTFTSLEGGIAEQRSDVDLPMDADVPELKLHPDSVIEWVLTPAEPTQGPVGVALLARSEGEVTKFVSPLDVEVSEEEGGVRLHGPLSEYVALDPGRWSIVLFVAPPQQLPSDASEASSDDPRWRSLPLRVTIVPEE